MPERQLNIDINGYWHAGTGRSSGTHLDAMTDKDANNLPFVGGKHLKGLLRQALRRAQHWQWPLGELPTGPAHDMETLLFGTQSQTATRTATIPGMLLVSDATLPPAELAFLQQEKTLPPYFYDALYATAISDQGAAIDKSLRGMEVCVPLQLAATLQLTTTAVDTTHRAQQQAFLDQSDAWQCISACLPLIDAVGAHRTRGLGEAQLSLAVDGKTTGVMP
jgi:hypothetical protein